MRDLARFPSLDQVPELKWRRVVGVGWQASPGWVRPAEIRVPDSRPEGIWQDPRPFDDRSVFRGPLVTENPVPWRPARAIPRLAHHQIGARYWRIAA
jgi:hypothetical protein